MGLVTFFFFSTTSDYNWANWLWYFNRKLDGDQTAWGQWNGLFCDYSRSWNGISFSGMGKEYKSQRNDNKWHSPVFKQKNDCFIWTRWWKHTDSHALVSWKSQCTGAKKKMEWVIFWKLFFPHIEFYMYIRKCSAHTHTCIHTSRKASYSHKEYSSALKSIAYTTLSYLNLIRWSSVGKDPTHSDTV